MSSRRRTRAVILTDEALQILNRRLLERWDELGEGGRFSRAACAGLLQLGKGTVERILGRKGNDRAVLVQAFERVGLSWDDAYCVPLEREQPDAPEPEPLPATALPRRVPVLGIAAAVAAIGLLGAGLMWPRSQGRHPEPTKSKAAESVSGLVAQVEQARQAFYAGDYHLATRLAGEAIRGGRLLSRADVVADAMMVQGEVLAAEGDLEAAVERFEQSRKAWIVLDQSFGLASVLENLGLAEARLGRLESARGHLQESIRNYKRLDGPGGNLAGAARYLGSIAAIQGDHDAALTWYDVARNELDRFPEDGIGRDLRALRALVMRDQGQHAEALSELQTCLKEWEGLRMRRWVAATLCQIASVHAAAGRLGNGRAALEQARTIYRELNDRRGVQYCEQVLARPDLRAHTLGLRLEEYF